MTDESTREKPLRRSVRVRFEGRVQGVGFRAFVERAAGARGLDGWVRNRRDGGVEAVFAGPADDVDAVVGACRRGPSFAHVTVVKILDESDVVTRGFDVRPTV